MATNKILIRVILFYAITIPIMILLGKYSNDYSNKLREQDCEYIKSINLNLNGIIIKKKGAKSGHDVGLVQIEISQTNIDFYDKTNERKRNIILIKNDKANLILHTISSIKINDSISIIGDKYQIFRNNYLKNESTLSMGFINENLNF